MLLHQNEHIFEFILIFRRKKMNESHRSSQRPKAIGADEQNAERNDEINEGRSPRVIRNHWKSRI